MKRFKVNNFPKISEVISVENIKDLGKNGFVIVRVDTQNPDELNDFAEDLGMLAQENGIKIVVTNKEIEVSEVVDLAESGTE